MRIVRFISPATGQSALGVDDGGTITEFGGLSTVVMTLRPVQLTLTHLTTFSPPAVSSR